MDATHRSGARFERFLARQLRWWGAACLAVLLSACGGGGGSGGASGGGGAGGPGNVSSVASLEVTPAATTVEIGGVAQYSVVARDAAGLVVATPPLTWSAATPAVGSIAATGLATGWSLGDTAITATAGGVVSPSAVLHVVKTPTVEAGACNGIAAVREWGVRLAYVYLDSIPPPADVTVFAEHDVSAAATLTPAGAFDNLVLWTGALAPADILKNVPGSVQLVETSSDHHSDPNIDLDVRGAGVPLPTDGVDGFTLTVDLSTCMYRFTMAPSVSVTITKTEHAILTLPGPDEGVRVYTDQILPLGLLQKGSAPLGDWHTLGLIEDHPIGGLTDDPHNPKLRFPSYSVAFPPADGNAYIPSGAIAQPGFFLPVTPTPRGGDQQYGSAEVSYQILPHF